MAAISLSLQRGVFKISDYTVGTLAPNAGADIELRFSTTDQLAAPVTMKDVYKAIQAFQRAITSSQNPNTRIFAIPIL